MTLSLSLSLSSLTHLGIHVLHIERKEVRIVPKLGFVQPVLIAVMMAMMIESATM
jgi:hypothetical protein